MALTSPGVEVTITDESQYLPAQTSSVPLVILATAQDKAAPGGTSVAQATTAANANKLFRVTSQRDLVSLYGNPFFYTGTDGTPIQGYELNEYGLLAAYSALGISNQVFCLRADIDLASLVGSTGRPTGAPDNNTYWLDTTTTDWGIYEWNATTNQFVAQTPIVITDSALLDGNEPAGYLGSVGDYAVIAIQPAISSVATANSTVFYKTVYNTWAAVGSINWQGLVPMVEGSVVSTSLTIGDTMTLSVSSSTIGDLGSFTVTVASSPDNNVYAFAAAINSGSFKYVTADVSAAGALRIFVSQPYNYASNEVITLNISGDTDLLTELGVEAGDYHPPVAFWGTSAQQPLWQASQTYPRPTGSVWFKVGSAGNGLNPQMSVWNSRAQAWLPKNVLLAESDWLATLRIDSSGGQNVPVDTIYAQYSYSEDLPYSPIYFWKRYAEGQTVILGSDENPVVDTGPAPSQKLKVYVSSPGSQILAGPYTVTVNDGDDANDFVTAWGAAAINNTIAEVTSSGAIQITHTEGGEIIIDDTWAWDDINTPQPVVDVTDLVSTYKYRIVSYGTTTDWTAVGATLYVAADSTIVNTMVVISDVGDTDWNVVAGTTAVTYNVGDIIQAKVAIGAGTSGEAVSLDFTATGAGTGDGTAYPLILGSSSGVTAQLGFEAGVTDGVRNGTFLNPKTGGSLQINTFYATGGSGRGFQTVVYKIGNRYTPGSVLSGGADYVVGDELVIKGYDLGGVSPDNDLGIIVAAVDGSGAITEWNVLSGTSPNSTNSVVYNTLLSNWRRFTYSANEGAPVDTPANGTNWFYSVVDEVDIMVNVNSVWKGYRNTNYDDNGFPTPTGTNTTDPNGPLVSASEPDTQSDGTPLAYGDIWISTDDLENYPKIYRWQATDDGDAWILLDNSDQVNPAGILFADARWAPNGTTNPADDPIPTIKSLLTSDYVDLDRPDPSLYPTGMLLFNLRRSGYNVKQYRRNYFNISRFPDSVMPAQRDAWVTISGLNFDGSPYMGRKAQRAVVTQALRAAVDTNVAIRDEDNFFNLMAAPGYPELQPNMVVLNSDRGETAYILGDTPFRLSDQATDLQNWATNAAGAAATGEDGCVTRNTYLGIFYPSGLASDLSGNLVTVPASHMMLRTFLRNDTVAYPWLAAAGTRRGIIDNATNIGYIDAATGEFQTIRTRVGIRDVLYTNFINPLVFFTGNGLLNYGNKTSFNSQSALDRTNVARLIAYMRRQLTLAARPFVFEPNDALTRQQIAAVVETLMVDLVAKRGIYDYLVVCDESNNTPARIDRNELWVDVAVEPVKAAEFIYIPVRILNTGELNQR